MKASDKTTMWVARGTVIVIAIVGAVIASNPNSSIFEIVSFAWAGFVRPSAPSFCSPSSGNGRRCPGRSAVHACRWRMVLCLEVLLKPWRDLGHL